MNKMTKLFTSLAATALFAGSASALPNEQFQGEPKNWQKKIGKELAVFVWHDDAGQHVRFTTVDNKVVRHFEGTICSDKVLSAAGVDLEDKDSVEIGPEGHCVRIDVHTNQHVDGVDFRIEGAIVKYDLTMDGKQLAPKHVKIGAKGKHPKESPFVLNRL